MRAEASVAMMSQVVTARTLTDGGQQPLEIARLAADFLGAATASLDLALYDLKLGAETEGIVIGALEAAAARGVAVRVAYNVDHRKPIPVPPPPESTPEDIARLSVPARAVAGIPDLMHHKFTVRDRSAVWTGSTNWTDDSWSLEENVLVTVESPAVGAAYTLAFEELWTTGDVSASGRVEPRPVDADGIEIRPWFCPGFREALSPRIAKAIGPARGRLRLCAPVITA